MIRSNWNRYIFTYIYKLFISKFELYDKRASFRKMTNFMLILSWQAKMDIQGGMEGEKCDAIIRKLDSRDWPVTVHYRGSEGNNYEALRFMVFPFTTIFIHLLNPPLKMFLETLCYRSNLEARFNLIRIKKRKNKQNPREFIYFIIFFEERNKQLLFPSYLNILIFPTAKFNSTKIREKHEYKFSKYGIIRGKGKFISRDIFEKKENNSAL